MRVLVTGAAGYLGAILVPMLLERKIEVKALDRFYFGVNPFEKLKGNPNLEIIDADTRIFDPKVLEGVTAVIDLAAVAQTDPEGLLPPALFYDMNYNGPFRVANLSKLAGVKRYVFASTTSIYGIREDIATEKTPVNPVEIYARSKFLAEQNVLKLNEKTFCVTALRFATLYGFSPRMRFDLLLNRMVLSAYEDNKILIGGGGEQQRVILHVKDAARAISSVLEEEEGKIGGEIFNIGTNGQNFKIRELAEIIRSVFTGSRFENYGDPDTRSFRANFDKAARVLGFKAEFSPLDAAGELRESLDAGLKPQENCFVVPWWLRLVHEGKVWEK